MKLECAKGSTVGLMAENTVIVWDNYTGETLYTLTLVSYNTNRGRQRKEKGKQGRVQDL